MKNFFRHIHTFLACIALFAITATFSSCDPDRPGFGDPGYDPGYGVDWNFVGSWELVSINSTPIYRNEYTTFDFWQNGTGNYGFYANNGGWYNQPISWTTSYDDYGRTTLYVNSSQGYFRYAVQYISNNTMLLLDIDYNYLLEYQRY